MTQPPASSSRERSGGSGRGLDERAHAGREYRDGIVGPAPRGRGAGLNPGNRFESVRLHVLGEHLDEIAREAPDGAQVRTRILRDDARTIVNKVNSPDIHFNWTVNPYRGCEHGCIYCYARPTHENLGYSCGVDFETTILAKTEAPELLKRELAKPSWNAEPIIMSGVTDPYQPIERELRITRGCLEVMASCFQPVSFVTKNRLILRDLDLLVELARRDAVTVAISVTTLDHALAQRMEPRASSPRDRLRTVRALRDAGVPVVVMVAPVIPGLTDRETPRILEAAADHGAQAASWVLLRLPYQIKDLFLEWLARVAPERAPKILTLIRDARGGELYDPAWNSRMRGEGAIAETIRSTFNTFAKRYGLNGPIPSPSGANFRRPSLDGQMGLF